MPDTPWSFDALHLAGARAALNPSQDVPLFLEQPLGAYETNGIGIDQLERFLRHPVRAFLRERLNVSLRDRTRDFEDAIPIELDAARAVADRRPPPGGAARRGQPGGVPGGRDRPR